MELNFAKTEYSWIVPSTGVSGGWYAKQEDCLLQAPDGAFTLERTIQQKITGSVTSSLGRQPMPYRRAFWKLGD